MRWAILLSALSYSFARENVEPRVTTGKFRWRKSLSFFIAFVFALVFAFKMTTTKFGFFVEILACEGPYAPEANKM